MTRTYKSFTQGSVPMIGDTHEMATGKEIVSDVKKIRTFYVDEEDSCCYGGLVGMVTECEVTVEIA